MAVERGRLPVDDDLRVAFGNEARLVAGDRADTHVAEPSDGPAHYFTRRASGDDLAAVARYVAHSNDSAHRVNAYSE